MMTGEKIIFFYFFLVFCSLNRTFYLRLKILRHDKARKIKSFFLALFIT